MRHLVRSALLFVAVGLAIYAGLAYASERLVYRTGRTNPLYKIATADATHVDWIILGASHAMPLDFADFNVFMQRETGKRILNLASPGTGPLYNRFVLEAFLRAHKTAGVLYVVDSFAFYSSAWNEDRFTDAKLMRRTPFSAAVAGELARYSMEENVDPRALLDYLSGFSKINNRERFEPDIWEGEKQFDRVYRPSASATRSRIQYLYPASPQQSGLDRYLASFAALVTLAQQHGARVVAIKMPVPAAFRRELPAEATFDAAMARLCAQQGVALHDFSQALDEPRFYFDTDHMNRDGLTTFLARDLKPILGGE
jgi:hypothetical protein